MPFFILKLFCEMNVYLPNLQEYFETSQAVFRFPNECTVSSNYCCCSM